MEAVKELRDSIAVCVVKHTNPCGLATGETLREAMEAAWAGDTISAFGSVIACSRPVDKESAEFLKGKFVEMIIAPGYSDDALEFLKNKSKNLRILEVESVEKEEAPTKVFRHVTGGMLEEASKSGAGVRHRPRFHLPIPHGGDRLRDAQPRGGSFPPGYFPGAESIGTESGLGGQPGCG